MSGGSMDYFYSQLDRYASDLGDTLLEQLAVDFAKVFKSREWYDSGDICEGTHKKTVYEFKVKYFPERLDKGDMCMDCKHWTANERVKDYGNCAYHMGCLYHGWETPCEEHFERKNTAV